MSEFEGKVVIVTGASQGIGLEAARLFAKRGAKVALVARSASILERIADELKDAIAVPTDMADSDAVRAMVRAVMQSYGRVDVLVNNAARGMHVTIEQTDIAKYRQALELNVIGPLAAMQAVIPIMRRQGGGSIVNVSSGVSKRIIPNVAPYASTKCALNYITLAARAELAKDNISVGIYFPGFTATKFHDNAISFKVDIPLPKPPTDTVEEAAKKLVEAVITGAEEVYADSIRPR